MTRIIAKMHALSEAPAQENPCCFLPNVAVKLLSLDMGI